MAKERLEISIVFEDGKYIGYCPRCSAYRKAKNERLASAAIQGHLIMQHDVDPFANFVNV